MGGGGVNQHIENSICFCRYFLKASLSFKAVKTLKHLHCKKTSQNNSQSLGMLILGNSTLQIKYIEKNMMV